MCQDPKNSTEGERFKWLWVDIKKGERNFDNHSGDLSLFTKIPDQAGPNSHKPYFRQGGRCKGIVHSPSTLCVLYSHHCTLARNVTWLLLRSKTQSTLLRETKTIWIHGSRSVSGPIFATKIQPTTHALQSPINQPQISVRNLPFFTAISVNFVFN